VLEVVGEIDLSSAAALRAAIDEAIGDGVRALVVDLEGVAFMDSSGLSVLVAAMRQLAEAGGRFAVVCTNPSLIKVFAVTGLDRVFHLGADLNEATTA
jgi:anti-sigma B factor antagonist